MGGDKGSEGGDESREDAGKRSDGHGSFLQIEGDI
jgi:hypothetical protein